MAHGDNTTLDDGSAVGERAGAAESHQQPQTVVQVEVVRSSQASAQVLVASPPAMQLKSAIKVTTHAMNTSKWLARQRTDEELNSHAVEQGGPLVALVCETGFFGHLMLFAGGLYIFQGRFVNYVYVMAWAVSFLACFSVCAFNLYWQSEPYHNLGSDGLTALIHVPVFIAWRFWRTSLRDQHFARLARATISTWSADKKSKVMRWLFRYVILNFVLMLVTFQRLTHVPKMTT